MRINPTIRRSSRLVALGVAAALVVVGCSGDDDTSSESASADEDEAALEAAADSVEEAEAVAAAAEAEAEELADELAATEADLVEAEAQIEDVTETANALVASETVRADTAEDEVERFSDLFPIVVESTLEGIELDQEGVWNLTWSEAYCDTFATCGTLPSVSQITYTKTPENFLRVVVPGILDAGLFAVDGSLYAITDSTTALPPCDDGTPRQARITISTYADDIVIDAEGNRAVTGLEGSVTIDSDSLTGCPGGLVYYGIQMSRP